MKGLVMKSTGSWYLVKVEARQYQCRVKGKLRLKGFKTTNPIAVMTADIAITIRL